MKHTSIFVFDLDGVITNPSDSSVDVRTIGYIHDMLRQGARVAVNSGRSYIWVVENLVDALVRRGADNTFDKLFIACEKGGESIKWNGGVFVPQPSRFALSTEAQALCRQVFENNAAQLATMFWDDTKQTMATVEKRPESDLAQFTREQAILTQKLHEAFAGHDVKIDPTTIATDIESPQAGKHAGAELLYEWATADLDTSDTGSLQFISFGDSKSDYEMARYFAQQGNASTFVFVGHEGTVFDEEPQVTLIRTDSHYAAGTNEYFENYPS